MSQSEQFNSEARKGKIDWRKKGLGWIPDYPDIRDFCSGGKDLQERGKLKKDEVTESLENIAVALIDALKSITEQSDIEQPNTKQLKKLQGSIKSIENTLQDKILGSIYFEKIRVYKILRVGVDAPVEVMKLKTYLSVLMQYDCIDNIFNNDLPNFLQWFNSTQFDENTKKLVERFQEKAKLKDIDGVVGIETYTALIELFENASRLKEFSEQKEAHRCKPILLSTPSLIPQQVFKIILDELELIKFWSCNSAQPSAQEPPSDQDKYTLLKQEYQLFLKSETEEIEASLGRRILDKNLKDAYFPFCKSAAENKLNEFIRKISDVFQNEFSIIDPIVSCIVQCISPIAQFNDQKMAIQIGFKSFCGYLQDSDRFGNHFQKYLDSDSDRFKIQMERHRLLHKPYYSSYQKLATSATCKFQELFTSGKEQVIDEIQAEKIQDADALATLYFYFLLKEFFPNFESSNDHVSYFSKKETVEIVEDLVGDCPTDLVNSVNTNPKSNATNGVSNAPQLFPLVELQIPICRSLRQTKKWQRFKSNRKYLFLPGAVDLSFWCSEIEDQKSLNACTAFAGASLIEYFINRSQNKYTDVSPLFLYKVTRNLMNQIGDVGASVRDTMKAIALFGVPPEKHWPYQEHLVDEEPPIFCYSFAQNYQALKYFRLDSVDISREALLFQIKAVLAAGFPCMFGFTVYSSAYEETNIENGYFPLPQKQRDKVVGGHAAVVVGYSDYKMIDSPDELGALLIRNSWGPEWGEKGYGWLPYSYVLKGLTGDWWSMLKSEWFDQDHFGLGADDVGGDSSKDEVVVDSNGG